MAKIYQPFIPNHRISHHHHSQQKIVQLNFNNNFPFQQPIQTPIHKLNQTQPIHQYSNQPIKTAQTFQKVEANRPSSSSKVNIIQINQDLQMLREQLKKISQKNLQINKNHIFNENQMHIAKLQSNQTRLMSGNLHDLRHESPNSQRILLNKKEMTMVGQAQQKGKYLKARSGQIIEPPSKKGKINNFMQSKQNKDKTPRYHQEIKIDPSSTTQLNEFNQKVFKLSSQIQLLKLQKQSLLSKLKNEQIQKNTLKSELKALNKLINDNKITVILENNDKIMIKRLETQINKLRNNKNNNIDSFLISQLEENNLFKLKLHEKDEEIREINDKLSTQLKINDDLKHQIKMLQLKSISQLKAKEKRMQIQLNDKSNEIQTYQRTLQTLKSKYQSAVTQIKEKDQFIANYILSRSKQEDKGYYKMVLQKYQINFPQNLTINNFLQEQMEIDKLKKEIVRLKSLGN